MSRIDLLTAQMRQRAVKRVSIQADERMKLFGDGDKFLGAGACLTAQAINDILSPIAPGPLDGNPITFCYTGRDGQFEIAVAPGGRSFDVLAMSFSPASTGAMPTVSFGGAASQSAPLQTRSAFEPLTPTVSSPAPEVDWYYCANDQQQGPFPSAQIKTLIKDGQIKADTLMWSASLSDWQATSLTEFKTLLPTMPSPFAPATDAFGNPLNVAPIADPENAWYYRSATGQTVPLDKATLVGRIKNNSLSPTTMVWREGMAEWKMASETNLLQAAPAAPLPSPTPRSAFGPRTVGNNSNPYDVYGTSTNNSGCGPETDVPKEARGLFNVGAFLFPCLWSYSMGLEGLGRGIFFFNILCRWVPFLWVLKIPLCLYLGFAGNRLAWQHRRWSDTEEFKKCQFLWATISAGVTAALWIIFALIYVWLVGQSHQYSSQFSPSNTTTSSVPLPPDNSQPFGPPPPSAP